MELVDGHPGHLLRTEPDHPFENDVETVAYLLKRDAGNLLLYSSSKIEKEKLFIAGQGGIERQFLNHRDEASASCDIVREHFDAPLVCHEAEREAVEKKCRVDETFSDRHHPYRDFEAIPTPGHCPGSTCYIWSTLDHRYLFSGDTIYLENGEWRVYISEQNIQTMIHSLMLIAILEFDVLVPGLYIGDVSLAEVNKEQAHNEIAAIIERLQNGATR